MSAVSVMRSRLTVWTGYAACVWAGVFAAPHVWWMLGVSAGFPGGDDTYAVALRNPWFVAYNLIVIILCGMGVVVALALVQPWGRRLPRWMLTTAAWGACALLTLRGLAGLVVDGSADLLWWPTFLLGGLLFGLLAYAGAHSSRSAANAGGRSPFRAP